VGTCATIGEGVTAWRGVSVARRGGGAAAGESSPVFFGDRAVVRCCGISAWDLVFVFFLLTMDGGASMGEDDAASNVE
jgi:hypothetical protein